MVQNVSKYQSKAFKAAVLSLSLLTIMAGAAVASGIGRISDAFPDVPTATVKLVVSLPPLFMIFSSLAVGLLSKRIKARPLVLSGLVVFIVGGVGAGFADSISQLLAFRAVLGIGTGMILPFSTGLIAACYTGSEKGKMMGYSFSANNLGALVANILAGTLAMVSWRDMFGVYLIGLISLLLILLFLKDLPDSRRPKNLLNENASKSKTRKIPSKTYLVALCAMALMMVFYLLVTNLALVVSERSLGGSDISGYLFAANTLVMMAMGATLTHTMRFNKFFFPLFLTILAIGLCGIYVSTSLLLLVTSLIFCGAGLGALLPRLISLASEGIPEEMGIKVMSVTMGFAWFGQFLSPLFYSGLSFATGLDTTCMFPLTALILVLAAGCVLVGGTIAHYLDC